MCEFLFSLVEEEEFIIIQLSYLLSAQDVVKINMSVL